MDFGSERSRMLCRPKRDVGLRLSAKGEKQVGLSSRASWNKGLRRVCAAAAALWTAQALVVGAAGTAETVPAPRLTIVGDHADGIYAVGQPIHWRVEPGSPSRFGAATYTLRKGGLDLVREGKLELASTMEEIDATLPAPGTLLLEVKATDAEGKAVRALAGAVVNPERIQPSAPRPADFDQFWQAKLEELAKVPARPQLVSRESGQTGVDYWQVTMDSIRGTHVRGQLARPSAGGKLPALLVVQSSGVYGLSKAWATDPAAAGWLALGISAHDLPIDQPPAFYEQQSQGSLADYAAIGNDDREKSSFLRMYLSCYRAAQYLTERPDWDGQALLVQGVGQGGLQALITAALHPKVSAAIAGVPAGCDLTGPLAGRSPGWPAWCWKTEGKDPAKVLEASRNYDVVNFASRIKCPVLVSVGLVDETCPPAGIFAALNQMKAPKEIVVLPHGDHQGSAGSHQAFNDRSRAWQEQLRLDKPAPVMGAH
ncbi:MAG TPA: acetylxylan esterase [Dongiaceae bacterium]|nr:acetylxylan esterase [Dongiaceae bacterium]